MSEQPLYSRMIIAAFAGMGAATCCHPLGMANVNGDVTIHDSWLYMTVYDSVVCFCWYCIHLCTIHGDNDIFLYSVSSFLGRCNTCANADRQRRRCIKVVQEHVRRREADCSDRRSSRVIRWTFSCLLATVVVWKLPHRTVFPRYSRWWMLIIGTHTLYTL